MRNLLFTLYLRETGIQEGVALRISSDRNDQMGQKSKPQKIPGPKFNPQNPKAEFPSHKNFQRNYAAGIRENYHKSSDCFEYPKNPY